MSSDRHFINKLISIIIIILLLYPAAIVAGAEGYGSIAGKVLDKEGKPVAGAYVEIWDYSYKYFRNTTTDANGTYWFDGIPVFSTFGYDHYKGKAQITVNNKTYGPARSLWFRVYSMQVATQDYVLDNYPPSGYGLVHGYVSMLDNQLLYTPATVYLTNGMYGFVSGLKGEEWQFTLPEGDYELWAERNSQGNTYISSRYKVHVTSDESRYLCIYLPLVNTTAYHDQPQASTNTVHGTIYDKNMAPQAGATVELCQAGPNGAIYPFLSAVTDGFGRYEFRDVKVNDVYRDCLIRSSFRLNGNDYGSSSPVFRVYYHNTINVHHDIPIDVKLDYASSGSASITSDPSGAYIWIDGKNTSQVTPYNFTALKAGPHECSLVKKGFFPENFTFEVGQDNNTLVKRPLRSNIGDVYLEVSPGDAMVYVDGAFAGNGSITLKDRQYGQYEYIVKRDGYYDESGIFEVVPGDTIRIKALLVAKPDFSITYLTYLVNNILYIIGSMFQ